MYGAIAMPVFVGVGFNEVSNIDSAISILKAAVSPSDGFLYMSGLLSGILRLSWALLPFFLL